MRKLMKFRSLLQEQDYNLEQSGKGIGTVYTGVLILLMIIGYWLRIRNLGTLGLVGDEGIEALAIQGILEHGVPIVDSGIFYGRWPLYLYIQAGFAYLFELNEFWLRYPSVIFGVAAIVPGYYLAKTLFNRHIGLLTALILAFSLWGIELSRYARGYTILQFLFLISLIFFYKGFMLDRDKYKYWFLISAAFTLLTHTMSDVLILLFLIPLLAFYIPWKRRVYYGVWAAVLAGMILIKRLLFGLKPTSE
ncbi:MAG: hypothetical protein GF372_09065, partial [Candidatus Marinimicrobia bacterium]|nr:hypothetical protein [Candidatus Neomarinimicrobiota bacterium]